MMCLTRINDVRKEYNNIASELANIMCNYKMLCNRCGEWYSNRGTTTGFYVDKKNKTGYFHICKDCILNMATDYDKKTGVRTDNKEKTKFVLKMMDLPYYDDVYNECLLSFKGEQKLRDYSCAWAKYIRLIKSLPKYEDKTWADSYFGVDGELEEGTSYVKEKKVTRTMIKRFGTTFSDDELIQLNDHYELLKSNNPNCDNNQEIFIEDLCKIKLLQTKAMSRGDVKDFDTTSKLYRDTFKQAGLRTVAEKDDSADETLGVTLQTIEQYTPTMYYKNKKLYKDFDGLSDYLERLIFRPLKNIKFGSTDRDEEFSIKDGDEDGFSES